MTSPYNNIKEIDGDITKSPDNIIIHGCNAQNVFGAGVALAIKKTYPQAFDSYKQMKMEVGEIQKVYISDNKIIFNVITQKYYGRNKEYTSYGVVLYCLFKIFTFAEKNNIENIAIPRIGCGLGGLKWNIMKKLIYQMMKNTPFNNIKLIIYYKK